MEVLLTENRAQNKIEYDQILLSYVLGNEAKRNANPNPNSNVLLTGLSVLTTQVTRV